MAAFGSAPAGNRARPLPSPYGEPLQPLIIAGDRLIGLSGTKVIYAFNIFTGDEIRNDGGFPYKSTGGLDGPITTAAGAIFFMEGGLLQARTLASGKPLAGWPAPAIDSVQSLAGFDGIVVAVQAGWNNQFSVVAYRIADGAPAWPNPLLPTSYSAGAVALGTDAVFYIAGNQPVAINTRFGETRFPKQPAAAPTYPLDATRAPLLTHDTAICCGDQVYAFDIAKGTLRWKFASPSGARQWWCALAGDGRWLAAVDSSGALFMLSPTTGKTICQTTLDSGGQPAVIGNQVQIVSADHRTLMAVAVDYERKQATRLGKIDLGNDVSKVGPAVGNATIFLPTTDGNLTARPFGTVEAAYFDGATCVTAPGDGGQFALGSGDFTIEAWVRSSEGGEILASYPAPGDHDNHGIRFNLTPAGELRFALATASGLSADAYLTGPTHAADGFWRHVAATRSAGVLSLWVDGISRHVYRQQIRKGAVVSRQGVAVDTEGYEVHTGGFPAPIPDHGAIGPQAKISIGAYQDPAPDNCSWFRGLIREVRIWDTAATEAALDSRRGKILTPNLPHLRGNWHLHENLALKEPIRNDVDLHEFEAPFPNGRSVVTDLALLDTFPYLLDQPALQWPYAPCWTARGDGDIVGSPVLSDDGVVLIRSRNGLGAVDKLTGQRKWSLPLDVACSNAVAYGQAFFLLAVDLGLIRIDSHTGHYTVAPGFETFEPAKDATRLAAPVHDGRYLASALPDGTLWLRDFTAQEVRPLLVGANPGDLSLADAAIYCVCDGPGGRRQLNILPTSGGAATTIAVDSEIFCVYGSWLFYIADGKLTGVDRDAQITRTATAVPGSAITGLAADPDAGLLVVTTNQGKVYGLSFATLGQRWVTTVPEGNAAGARAAKGVLNPPAVDGRDVFITSRSGVAAALDGRNGQVRGFFRERNAAIGAPVEDAGTIYFGCDAAGAKQHLDGGLHTVAFGETYSLRLGLDPFDQDDTNPGYARIERPKPEDALAFREISRCTVEAWINTAEPGEILSICPSSASRQGLRLRIAEKGTLQFTLYDEPDAGGPWRHVEATAKMPKLGDAAWRHIAVSVAGETDIRAYFDGERCPVTLASGAATVPHVVPGSLIYIGADATAANGIPTDFFRGLVSEVRVWDTYLTADDIATRMHTKLRGDEPDLAAYWNFDAVGVVDASRNGFDGTLAPDNGDATFWLTDLHFQHPNYPDLVTEAAILQVGESGLPAGDPRGETEYRLTLTAKDGAGAPQVGQKLRLWYVKHADIDDANTVTVVYNRARREMPGIAPHELEDNPPSPVPPKCLELTTDPSGKAELTVRTTVLAHGPSFDVWAGYMPAHERYHVNVLLRDQLLAKPSPPYIAAQSKLIQDYHWSAGGDIDEKHTRPTYRTVIRTLEANGSPRPNERIRINAAKHVRIEVAGREYDISLDNSRSFVTNHAGELVVVMSAEDMLPPLLKVWAGFLSPASTYTIDPADDAHGVLADTNGDDMKDPNRMTNWRKPPRQPERKSLLKDDYKPHSEKIADTIRHVMAPTRSKAGDGQRPQPLGAADAPARCFADMRQPPKPALGDAVRAIPTLRHIDRKAVVTPEYLRESLHKASPGAIGFHIKVNHEKREFSFGYLTTPPAFAAAGGGTVAIPQGGIPLGFGFGDVWDGATSFARKVWDKATEIAVTVGDAIRVAIYTVERTAVMVAHTVADAVMTVVEFLKKIALEIWEIILFLLMLFDWEAILKAHTIIRHCIENAAKRLSHDFSDVAKVRTMLHPILDFLGVPQASGGGASAASIHSGAHAAIAAVHGVGANSIRSRADEQARDAQFMDPVPLGGAAVAMSASAASLMSDMVDLAGRLASMSASDGANAILDLLRKAGTAMLSGMVDVMAATIVGFAGVAAALVDAACVEIDIPFLSALYKWITGDELSILSLFCLALGAAAHVVSVIVTGTAFYHGADGLEHALLPAPALRAHAAADLPLGAGEVYCDPNPLSYGRPDNKWAEIAYLVLRFTYLGATLATDSLFAAEAAARQTNPCRSWFKILRGLSGISADCIFFVQTEPAYARQMAAAFNQAQLTPNSTLHTSWEKMLNVKVAMVFASSMAGNLITLAAGIRGVKRGGDVSVPFAERLLLEPDGVPMPAPTFRQRALKLVSAEALDAYEFYILSARSIATAAVNYAQFWRVAFGTEFTRSIERNDSDMLVVNRLLFARDLLNSVSKFPAFVYTRTYFDANPGSAAMYNKVRWLRAGSVGAAIALHGYAEFHYLLPMPEPQ